MTKTQKRIVWWALIVLAGLIVLVALFYGEENWRGKHAWENCKRELEAKGEVLDWKAYIPAPVSDEQNIFKAPNMTEWFVRTNRQAGSGVLTKRLSNTNTVGIIATELAATNYLAWSDQFEPDFDLMRDALKRPYTRMDGNYEQPFAGPIVNFVALRSVAQTLAQRAKCYLLLGQPENALQELTPLNDLRRLAGGGRDGKPMSLVTAMINVAIAGLYLDVITDGFEKHAWGESQLVSLQEQLAQINLLPLAVDAFRSERAGVCQMLENLLPPEVLARFDVPNPSFQMRWFMIRGWFYQNMVTIAMLEQKPVESIILTNNLVLPSKLKAFNQELETMNNKKSPYTLLAEIAAPRFDKAALILARNQTTVNESFIICVLEHYRLAHGEYPETLAVLMPKIIEKIPHDIIGGQPLKYHRTDDGRFLLYSIGWNETDDGGQVVLKKDGTEDREKGDWVWPPPSNR